MSKIKFPLLLILIFSILFTGCNVQTNTQNKSESNSKEVKSSETTTIAGTTLGLFDDKTSLNKLNSIFKIESKNSFSPQIDIHNRDTKENIFRLFFILDYEQSNVQYDNQHMNYIDILLKPNEKKELKIKLNNLSTGLHDFIIFCIRRPDDLLSKPKFFPPGHFNIVKRSTLIVGEQNNKYIDYKNLNVEPTDKEIPLFVSEQPRNTVKGEFVTLINKENTPLWINFSTKPENKYAVLTFVGKELEKTDFYKSENQGVTNIPLNLKMEGDNNLLIAVVENPFTIQDEKSSRIPWSVQTTNRISIKQ